LYPTAPSTLTVGGVDFMLERLTPNSSSSAVIQPVLEKRVATLDTSIFGATTVYTLISTAYGSNGNISGYLDFIGDKGARHRYTLTQGVNLRDHLVGGLGNQGVTDPTIVTATFTNGASTVRLDRQTIILPTAFESQTLKQVVYTWTSSSYFDGTPFLAGMTVEGSAVVPEPATLTVWLLGTGCLGFVTRRRAKRLL